MSSGIARPGWMMHRRRGQALVEMALVIMMLMILSMGIADFGLLMYRYVQAANCVREAARLAAVGKDLSDEPYCPDGSLSGSVAIGYTTDAEGDSLVTARLDIDHSWLAIGALIPGLGSTVSIVTSETMYMEPQIDES